MAEVVLATVDVGAAEVVGAAVDLGADGWLPAVPPAPGFGPAMLVVIEPDSMNIPDQNQSSAAVFVLPFGKRSCPICQSAEFVEVAAFTGWTTCLRSSAPVEAQSPTV